MDGVYSCLVLSWLYKNVLQAIFWGIPKEISKSGRMFTWGIVKLKMSEYSPVVFSVDSVENSEEMERVYSCLFPSCLFKNVSHSIFWVIPEEISTISTKKELNRHLPFPLKCRPDPQKTRNDGYSDIFSFTIPQVNMWPEFDNHPWIPENFECNAFLDSKEGNNQQ